MSYGGPEYDDNPYAEAPEIRTEQYGNSQQRMPDGASTILICGILSLVVCAPIGIAAWVMGNTYMSQCRRMRVEPDGVATAGRICGIVGTVLFGLQIAMMMFWLVIVIGVGVANG